MEYIIDSNGTQAAIRAGYSPKTAQEQSARLLSKVIIQEEIARLLKPIHNRLSITAENVLREAARIAFFDIRKVFDDKGNLKNIQDLDDDTAAALASVENEQLFEGRGDEREYVGDLKKIKTFDKKGMVETLMKYLKLLTERHEVVGADGKPLFRGMVIVRPNEAAKVMEELGIRDLAGKDGSPDSG
jgi:phage terminase small subunit